MDASNDLHATDQIRGYLRNQCLELVVIEGVLLFFFTRKFSTASKLNRPSRPIFMLCFFDVFLYKTIQLVNTYAGLF
jgi:hypothetical protein